MSVECLVPIEEAQRAVDEALAQLEDWRTGLLEVMKDAHEEGGVNGAAFAVTFAPCLSKATFIHLVYGFGDPGAEPVVPIDGQPLGEDVLWPVEG
jgi:hypothetical protein